MSQRRPILLYKGEDLGEPPKTHDDSPILMTTYTIYDHPADYPEWFVVRRWFMVRGVREPVPDGVALLVTTVEAARAQSHIR